MKKEKVRDCARAVLEVRAQYPDESLSALYHPRTMPSDLVAAHRKLDRAVDACYRPARFEGDLDRLKHLFELYKVCRNGGQLEMLPREDAKKPRKKK